MCGDRMETLDSDDEKKSFLLEDIDGSQQWVNFKLSMCFICLQLCFRSVCSTNSSEGVTINKVKLAEDSHANIKLQKRRKKIETRYQKALMKLHELIKCLDSIGEKFSVEGISRKVLRAPVSIHYSYSTYIIYLRTICFCRRILNCSSFLVHHHLTLPLLNK